jgi:hypothetical protein
MYCTHVEGHGNRMNTVFSGFNREHSRRNTRSTLIAQRYLPQLIIVIEYGLMKRTMLCYAKLDVRNILVEVGFSPQLGEALFVSRMSLLHSHPHEAFVSPNKSIKLIPSLGDRYDLTLLRRKLASLRAVV